MFIIVSIPKRSPYDLIEGPFQAFLDFCAVDIRKKLKKYLAETVSSDPKSLDAFDFPCIYEDLDVAIASIHQSIEARGFFFSLSAQDQNFIIEFDQNCNILSYIKLKPDPQQIIDEDELGDFEKTNYVFDEKIENTLQDKYGNKPSIYWFLKEMESDEFELKLEENQIDVDAAIYKSLLIYFNSLHSFKWDKPLDTPDGLTEVLKQYFVDKQHELSSEKTDQKWIEKINYNQIIREAWDLFKSENFICFIHKKPPEYPCWINNNTHTIEKSTYEAKALFDWYKINPISPITKAPFGLQHFSLGFNPYQVQEELNRFLNEKWVELKKEHDEVRTSFFSGFGSFFSKTTSQIVSGIESIFKPKKASDQTENSMYTKNP